MLDVAVSRLTLENIKLSSGLKRCQRVAVKRRHFLYYIQFRAAESSSRMYFGLWFMYMKHNVWLISPFMSLFLYCLSRLHYAYLTSFTRYLPVTVFSYVTLCGSLMLWRIVPSTFSHHPADGNRRFVREVCTIVCS